MICTAENKQFIEKILEMKADSITTLLKQQDQKYIIRRKHQIIEHMPQLLKPDYKIQQTTTSVLKNLFQLHWVNPQKQLQSKKGMFPSMFHQKSKSNHWDMKIKYTESKIMGSESKMIRNDSKNVLTSIYSQPYQFESGIKGEFDHFLGSQIPSQPINLEKPMQTIKQEIPQVKTSEVRLSQGEKQKQISFKKIENSPQNIQSGNQADNQQFLNSKQFQNQIPAINQAPNPFVSQILQQSKYSPFISNKTNFMDPHTNKKLTTASNYISPETYSMNMLQFVHKNKRENMFNDGYSFPNVVMKGSGTGWMNTAKDMRQNPFQKTFQQVGRTQKQSQGRFEEYAKTSFDRNINRLQKDTQFRSNVQDVLKYTLGDRRYTNTIPQRNETQQQNSNQVGRNPVSIAKTRQRVLENPFVRKPASTAKY